ncbi:MAG: RecQ family ATP-dependent DNA helicase, partial [Muribaculaceae bacterium]|nr:RecQ family ATP-dependent DNA helicase [Muribaculaceae bacterium]
MSTPSDILSRYWGYDSFRPRQLEIIESVLAGRDTVGLLPTGGGKSITFQVPALMMRGITLVITPLISLMKDQVDNLRQRGITAVCIHSGLSRQELRLSLDRARLGKTRLVYVSPERLQRSSFIGEMRQWDISMIEADEAHCISQWGYDFRPDYLRIAALRKEFPDAVMLALTASATPEVVRDIKEKLEMRSPALFSLSFSRNNISYLVRRGAGKEEMMVRILSNTSGSAIVYVRSRKRTSELAALLVRNGISADSYHAGISPEEKNEKQNRWKDGSTRVIVATNAFGMGIEKPDVRVVVHYDLQPSLEEYYQ